VLGIIPARGGSKGVLKKNIASVGGAPLIAYTIKAASQSTMLSEFIVSTDSQTIAEIALKFGAAVPFMRPAELATDTALSVDVVKHGLLYMEGRDQVQYDYVVMLQPTSPLRTGRDIDECVRKLIATNCDSVVSLVDVGATHPARMYWIKDDALVPVIDEGVAMRPRQDLPPVYIRNGAVYAVRRAVIFEYGNMIGKVCRAYIMPPERSINIDSAEDLLLTEYYLSNMTRSVRTPE
jgi:CMP-N,N'-diacetyllegionaminic acid synthase